MAGNAIWLEVKLEQACKIIEEQEKLFTTSLSEPELLGDGDRPICQECLESQRDDCRRSDG